MSDDDVNNISRRAALQRLGLGALAAYVAPAFSTLSIAHAASGGSGGGGSGGGGSGGGASGGGASGGDAASGGASGGAGSGESEGASGASSGATSGASTSDRATISAADHERARRAVRRGEAMPLRDVLSEVNKTMPGRLISVKYRESQTRNTYVLKMISKHGKLVVVHVNAQTAAIIR